MGTKRKGIFIVNTLLLLCFCMSGYTQQIPSHRVLEINELSGYLKADVKKQFGKQGLDTGNLAVYFREKFSERYFYNWQHFGARFTTYSETYSTKSDHISNAKEHMDRFPDSTKWILPFDDLLGQAVNAYSFRHLSRQHKMLDVAFAYFYSGRDPKFLQYFKKQLHSLKVAIELEEYEKINTGNGVFEVFRSGYRILNWLQIHNMFLGEPDYTDGDQLHTIAILLQHGAHLYENNAEYSPGNHQTRGMSALAMLAMLFSDFEDSNLWLDRALSRLEEHMTQEINADGFQFERSVHYHISDIANYFYVYQLAKITDTDLSEWWKHKLESLFLTLAKIAYPDKSAPVLQDDTDNPWAEKNEITECMALGFVLFENPAIGYFASDRVESKLYWYLTANQLDLLNSLEVKKPEFTSLFFPETHYYVMRSGWDDNDKMMIISAGLDEEKPDHQHGDMLGIQAMAFGKVLLPNYQVRYSLEDYPYFKNSMVKNVALVDDALQGKKWTSNKGGSGFGKFGKLPKPEVVHWMSNDHFDYFVGTHDGFEDLGVSYCRQIIFVKNDFWIIRDDFQAKDSHDYKQVWQGHYSYEEGPTLIRSNFDNAAGCDIYQLLPVDSINQGGARGKEWSAVTKKARTFSFLTMIYPYQGYEDRINERVDNPQIKGWVLNDTELEVSGPSIRSIKKGNNSFLFGVENLQIGDSQIEFSREIDVFVQRNINSIILQYFGCTQVSFQISGNMRISINSIPVGNNFVLNPGDLLLCEK